MKQSGEFISEESDCKTRGKINFIRDGNRYGAKECAQSNFKL